MITKVRKIMFAVLILVIGGIIISGGKQPKAQAAVNEKEQSDTYLNTTVKYLDLGQKTAASYDFNIKNVTSLKGAEFTWYVKSDKGNHKAVTINSKTGVVTAKEAGTAYICCKITLADGRSLSPEAKVVVRNNITEVDIVNIPAGLTLTAGRSMNFNRVILNTSAGRGKTSEGITRWEISDDTTGAGKVTASGIVLPTKAGTFSIRAVCFQSKEKYGLWLKDKKANGKYITAFSKWYKITVTSAAMSKVTVSTQEELDKALASNDNTEITISTDMAVSLVITSGEYKDKVLVVNAPNAEIENYAIFKNIIIKAIKENTWKENADGNSFHVTSIRVRIIVNGTAEVKEIIFDREDSVINVEVEGKVHQITILKPAELNLSGTGEQVPITIEETGDGSKITTSIPLSIEAAENLDIVVNPGAEGTTINKSKEDTLIKVENNSSQSVVITTKDKGEETVNAGESGVSGGSPTPSPVLIPESAKLVSLSIKTQADKRSYFVGEALDISGLVVEGVYSDASLNTMEITTANINGFDSSAVAAKQILTITCDGVSIKYSIEIKPIKLSITAPTVVLSKVYDGTKTAEVTPGTLSGVVSGDEVSISTEAFYDTGAVGEGKTITIEYAISGADADKYIKPADEKVTTGGITARELMIGEPVLTKEKVYDGTDVAEITAGILSGVVEGDNITLSTSAVYNNKAIGSGKTITVAYSLSGLNAGNYAVPKGFTVNTGEITALPLSVKTLSFINAKEYDGTATAEVTLCDLSGIVDGDEVTVLTKADYETKAIGTDKRINFVFSLSGADANNYIKPADDYRTTGVITSKQLTVTEPELTLSKLYDGTTAAEITSGNLSGLINGEEVFISAEAKYDTAAVGESKTINITYSITGTDIGNYIKPVDEIIATGSIKVKQLYITEPILTKVKAYDGTTVAEVTAGILSGVLIGDTVTISATAAYDSKTAGIGKTITVSYSLNGTDAGNYSAPVSSDVNSCEITTLPLSVTTLNYQATKEYDNSSAAEVILSELSGVLPGDDVNLITAANYDTNTVGIKKRIDFVFALSGADIQNYTKPDDEYRLGGEITAKQLTITKPELALNKIYDGTATADVTAGSLTGIVSGDEVVVSAEAIYDSAAVGKGKTIIITYAISGADADNYIKPADYTVFTGEISAKQLTVTKPAITSSKLYDGKTSAGVIAGVLSGVLEGDSVTVNATATYDNKSVGTEKNIRVRYILSGDDADQYLPPADYIVKTGIITPIKLSVSSYDISKEKVYDGNTEAEILNIEFTGVLSGDSVNFNTAAHYENKEAGDGKRIIVEYSFSGADAPNYNLPGSITIEGCNIIRKQLIITEPDITLDKLYDGNTATEVTIGEITGVALGDDVTASAIATFDSKQAGENKTITVTYTLAGTDISNYLTPDSYSTATGSISTLPLTITNPKVTTNKVYDTKTTAAAVPGILLGIIEGDTVSVKASAAYANNLVGVGKTITVSYALVGEDAVNYTKPANYVTRGEITVKPLAISDPIITTSKIYDSNRDAEVFIGTLSGVLPGDYVTISGTAVYDDKTVGTGKTITVKYSLGGEDAGMYKAPEDYVVTDGVISGIQLIEESVDLPDGKYYDGTTAMSVNSYNVTGVITGDDVTVDITADFDTKMPGSDKTITIDYIVSGSDAGNYIKPERHIITPAESPQYYISKKPITISDPNLTVEKVYDATSTAEVIVGESTGIVEGEEVIISASAVYDSAEVGTGKTITVTYMLTGADSDKYVKPSDYIIDTATIAPIQLTITAPSITYYKEYDRTNTSSATAGTLSGVLEGEEVTLSLSAAYDNKNAGSNKIITVTYTISGEDAEHYTAPAPYSISNGYIWQHSVMLKSFSYYSQKEYDGNTSARIESADFIGLDGDDISVSVAGYYETPDIGSGKRIDLVYTITGPDAGNYSGVYFMVIWEATIIEKKLTISEPALVHSKQYDRTTTAEVVEGTLTGVVEGEDVTVSATASYDTADIGTGKKVTVVYTLSGADAAHYIKPDDYVIEDGVITERPLTFTGQIINSEKGYDGDTSVAITQGTLVGVLEGDDVSASISAVYDNKNAGSGKTISVTYTLSGEDAALYKAPENYTIDTAVINKRRLYADSGAVMQKTYDGTTSAALLGHEYGIDILSDDFTVTFIANYDTPEVGTGKTITITFIISGPDAANYYALDKTLQDAEITTKQLTISETDLTLEKGYDGTTTAQVTAGTLSGIVNEEDVQVNATAVYDNAVIGTGKTITVSYTLTGTAVHHYTAPEPYTVTTGIITEKQLSIAEPVISLSKLYDRNTVAEVTAGGLIGVAPGEDVSVTAKALYETPDIGEGKKITVTYTLSGKDMAKYMKPVDYVVMDGAITTRPLSVVGEIIRMNKIYDGNTSVEVTQGSLTGILTDDSVILSTKAMYDNKTAGTGKTITVEYTISGEDADLYSAPESHIINTASIATKALSFNSLYFSGSQKEYDGNTSVNVIGCNFTGVLAGDDAYVSATASYETPEIGYHKIITFVYTVNGVDAANYTRPDNDYMTSDDTAITEKHLTISKPEFNSSKEYDGSDAVEFSLGTLSGVVAGEEVYISAEAAYSDAEVGTGKTITVTYTLSGTDASHYIKPADYIVTTGEITAKHLIITTGLTTVKAYDNNTSAAVNTRILEGIIEGETVSISATAAYDSKTAGKGKSITVVYTLSGANADHYFKPDNYVTAGAITALPLTVTGTELTTSKTYDGSTSAAVVPGTFTGVLDGDSVTLSALASYNNKNVGSGKELTVTYTPGGEAGANYYVEPYTVDSGVITPAQITVKAPGINTTKEYDGSDTTVLSDIPIDGVIFGDDIILSATLTYNSKDVGTEITVSVYFELSGADGGNYNPPDSYTTSGAIVEP